MEECMKKTILMFLLSAVLSVQVCTPAKASGTDTPELPDASSASEETHIEYENTEDTSEAETAESVPDSSSEDKMTNEAPSSDSDTSDSEEEDRGPDSSASNVEEDENQDDRAGYYEPDEKYPGVYTDKDPEFTVVNDTTLKYDEENK
jgi:cytoskeletal protein RodZ